MLYDLLLRPPGADPAATALVSGELRLSRADLDRAATALAGQLADRGVGPETPVASLMPNSPEMVVAVLACIRLQARLVMLDPALKPTEGAACCRRASARLVLVPAGRGGDPAGAGDPPALAVPAVAELLASRVGSGVAMSNAGGDDRSSVVFMSSGSTGRPKMVIYSSKRIVSGIGLYGSAWPHGPQDRIAAVLPMFHSWGFRHLLVTTLAAAATLHLLPHWPRPLAGGISRERLTILYATPFILRLLVETDFRPAPDFSSLRLVLSGGAPLLLTLAGQFREKLGPSPVQLYGSTECALVLIAELPDGTGDGDWRWRPGPGITVSVRGPDGKEAPEGTVGTLAVRSPATADGYLDDPQATARTFLEDGFVLTGDAALRDASGRLKLLGRERPMLNVAGKKASPAEIETCLRQHPAVLHVTVLATQTPNGDDRIKAVVSVSAPVTAQALREFCVARLAAFKVPREIEFAANAAAGPLSKPRLESGDAGR